MKIDPTSLLYAGTYAEADAPGIHLLRMDAASGSLQHLQGQKAGPNPSFLAISPDGKFLYAVNQLFDPDGKSGGVVSAFEIDPESGHLAYLNNQPSHGAGPCHLTTDRQGRFLLVANYRSGSMALYPLAGSGLIEEACQILQHTGQGIRPEQGGPHAHYIAFSPDNRFCICCDLGIDQVMVYRFDPAAGALTMHGEAATSPGAGPRHLDFAPDGSHAYLINELDSTMTAYAYAAELGTLRELQTISTLPEGYTGLNSCAEIYVHPSGNFVYGSNRGHDSIVVFRVAPHTGMLELVQHESTRGKAPRNFVIDPTGRFLLAANQDSDTIVSFRIDSQTGTLTSEQSINLPKPVCLKFLLQPG